MPNLIEGSPARYHLGTNSKAIEIAVNKSVIPTAEDFPTERTAHVRKDLDLQHSFIPPSADKEWGFGPVIQQAESMYPDWVIFQAQLPKMSNAYDEKGFAFAATLNLLFLTLNNMDKESTSGTPQFSHINLINQIPRIRNSSNSMDVKLFNQFMNWIKQMDTEKVGEEIGNIMLSAYCTLRNQSEMDREYWRSYIAFRKSSDENMYFRVPGDATELQYSKQTATEILRDEAGNLRRGSQTTKHKLTTKNMDRVDSQITALAGIAKLEELATGGYFRQSTK